MKSTMYIVASIALASAAFGYKDPVPADVIASMAKADDYFKSQTTDWQCGWTRGTYIAGEFARWEVTKNESVQAYLLEWATQNKYQICSHDHGGQSDANNQLCGATYLDLYRYNLGGHTKDQIEDTLSVLGAQTEGNYWSWIDAFFMGAPTYARAALVSGNDSYYSQLMTNFNSTAYGQYHLWDSDLSLFYRDDTYIGKKEPNGKPVMWGRGNGWAIASSCRILQAMPDRSDRRRDTWETLLKQMAGALSPLQNTTDGMWRSALLDAEAIPNPETTASALNTFAFAYGVNEGILPEHPYRQQALEGWRGLTSISLQEDGFLGYCQKAAGSPGPASPTDTTDYCVGQFLLAGSEIWKLVR